jgi:hypothetical protein
MKSLLLSIHVCRLDAIVALIYALLTFMVLLSLVQETLRELASHGQVACAFLW